MNEPSKDLETENARLRAALESIVYWVNQHGSYTRTDFLQRIASEALAGHPPPDGPAT